MAYTSACNNLGNYCRSRTNIITLATALGYRQIDIATALGVEPAAVSRWRTGNREPDDACWDNLLKLKESLEATGQLGCENPLIAVNPEGGNVAKNTQKSPNPVPPPSSTVTFRERDNRIKFNGNSKSSTVTVRENGGPNCNKCPFKGLLETLLSCGQINWKFSEGLREGHSLPLPSPFPRLNSAKIGLVDRSGGCHWQVVYWLWQGVKLNMEVKDHE